MHQSIDPLNHFRNGSKNEPGTTLLEKPPKFGPLFRGADPRFQSEILNGRTDFLQLWSVGVTRARLMAPRDVVLKELRKRVWRAFLEVFVDTGAKNWGPELGGSLTSPSKGLA